MLYGKYYEVSLNRYQVSVHRQHASPWPVGFTDRLAALMQRKGWGVYELAEASGLTPQALYPWVRGEGKRPPKAENVEAVAKALGVTYGELWGSEGLTPHERTRLLQLEAFVASIGAQLDAIRPPAQVVKGGVPTRRSGPPPSPDQKKA